MIAIFNSFPVKEEAANRIVERFGLEYLALHVRIHFICCPSETHHDDLMLATALACW